MTSRIEQLEQFAEDDPADPFNLYALALEYQKFDIPRALLTFQLIVDKHPGYLATYYQLGKLHQVNGEQESAKQIFSQGIKLASAQKDLKTQRELQSALRELDDDD